MLTNTYLLVYHHFTIKILREYKLDKILTDKINKITFGSLGTFTKPHLHFQFIFMEKIFFLFFYKREQSEKLTPFSFHREYYILHLVFLDFEGKILVRCNVFHCWHISLVCVCLCYIDSIQQYNGRVCLLYVKEI